MNKSFLTLAALAVLSLGACGGQNDSGADNKTEAAAPAAGAKGDVEARERLMKAFKKDVGTMGKMVKGEAPYDAAAFKAAADNLSTNATQPWEHYTEASSKEESDAKPEVWSHPDEFKQKADDFMKAVETLKVAAAGNTLDSVKKPFGDVGQSCKACHDTFRHDD